MASVLHRRAFLGVSVRETEGDSGLTVGRVIHNAIADAYGFEVDDTIVSIDGKRIDSIDAVRDALRAPSDGSFRLEVLRGNETLSVERPRADFPIEKVPGSRVHNGEVTVRGARLRTILTTPEAGDADRPTVVFLPGITPGSTDFALRERAPTAQMIHGWAAGGLNTLRVERHGEGDSDPAPGDEADFELEHAGYRAGIESIGGTGPVVIFGHSVGAMHAALMASDVAFASRAKIAGIVSFGSSSARWGECLRDGLVRQMELRKAPEEMVAQALAHFDSEPFAADGSHGRPLAFHTQLDKQDLEAAWRGLKVPALVLRGEFDWVVGHDEQAAMAALAGVEPVDLAGLDHAMTWHDSREKSLRGFGRGRFDQSVVDAVVTWVGKL